MPESEAALLVLESARIEAGGAIGGALTAAGGGERLVVAGAFRPLFRLLTADARLASGRALLAGVPVAEAVQRGVAGVALCDPAFVAEWTVQRFLVESATLAGISQADARRRADAAIATFELQGWARTRLGTLFPPARRVVTLAHATLANPAVVCAETPLAGSDSASRPHLWAALDRAAGGRRSLVSVSTLALGSIERELAARADWIMLELGGAIVREGPPATTLPGGSFCIATVTRESDAFLAELTARGLPATLRADPRDTSHGGPVEVLVDLPEGAAPNDVLLAAERAGSPLVELVSL